MMRTAGYEMLSDFFLTIEYYVTCNILCNT